jgi:hypothetical protein
MKPKKVISEWLFARLAGVFVEGTTLYVPNGSVGDGFLAADGVEVEDGRLVGYSITEGRVYPIATKEDVRAPYVTYDNISVVYDVTKDGSEPESLTCRVLCVDRSYTAVDALADAVEAEINNAWVAELDGALMMTSRRSDFDASTGEYVEELFLSINM